MTTFIFFFVTLVLFFIVIVAKGVVIIRQSETMVIERLGQYKKTLRSGLHVVIPLMDRPRPLEWRFVDYDIEGNRLVTYKKTTKIDLRETVHDFPPQNVITKDNVVTEINALLFYQVTDSRNVVYEINNLPQAIEKLAQTSLRSLIGEMTLDQTLSSRDIINLKLKEILDEATEKWGVKVNRVELQDINPPEDVREAMEKEMKAERNRRAAVTEAEGTKTSRILESEGERGAAVNKAEGEKKTRILEAEGSAYARIRTAQAEAESIKRINEAFGDNKKDPTQYLIAVRYIDALKQMVNGNESKVVFIPYEASAVLSSLGSMKEMFKEINLNKETPS